MNPTTRNIHSSRLISFLKNTGIMLGIVLVTVVVSEMLRRGHIDDNNLIMLYLLAVMVIARATPTYFYGLAGSVLCTLACDYFVTEPRFGFSFTVGTPITVSVMFAITILTSTITAQMRDQTHLAMEREHRAQLLYEINQQLLLAVDLDAVVQLASDYLVSHLEFPVIFYIADPKAVTGCCQDACFTEAGLGGSTDLFHTPDELKRVHNIFKHGAAEALRPDVDTDYAVQYFPLISKETVLGVIGIACREEDLTPGNLTFVKMFTGQVTLALELQYLAAEQQRTLVDAEKESLRSILLRSISHDLRTPLTSIVGASSTILERKSLAGDPEGEKMIKDIRDNAQWLTRMVENLLVITRIAGVKVIKTPEAAEEVVAEAVKIVRARFPDYSIHVHAPEELLMAPMDATLISQVIINLLENAAKNSPPESLILLDLEKKGGCAQFSVSDNGQGIPDHLLGSLFEVHKPLMKDGAVDVSRGLGIGLSICTAIVKAHGGTIEGYNHKNGGASFVFRLPLTDDAENGAASNE